MTTLAQEQKDALGDFLDLLSNEPVVLEHAVNSWFFSSPNLVADEKGRRRITHTDKHISAAFFEAIHNAVKNHAIWAYLGTLLTLLENSTIDKVYRGILLQELSNVVHLEYSRAQAVLKRHVQSGTGSKWFKRVSNAFDTDGNARVTMKGSPEELTLSNPQLHYVLRLCHPDTTAPKSIGWLKKLTSLYESHPLERDNLEEREADSLGNVAAIAALTQDLSSATSMPPFSRKKGRVFASKTLELEAELGQLRKPIDLRDFAVPIPNLLEPGMAEHALKALDEYVTEKAGINMGLLYYNLVEDCILDLQRQHTQANAKNGQKETPLPFTSTAEPPKERIDQRRTKDKTRPSPQLQSSIYTIIPQTKTLKVEASPAPTANPLKVSTSTKSVFSDWGNRIMEC